MTTPLSIAEAFESGIGAMFGRPEPVCPYWADKRHAFTGAAWIDGEGKKRLSPGTCVPRRLDGEPPDLKFCACGEEVGKR